MENLTVQNLGWNPFKKVAFRFFFVFFVLFIAIYNNGAYPFWYQTVSPVLQEPLHKILPWIGKNILHIQYEIRLHASGSGDSTYDYLVLLAIAMLAFIGTIVWSTLDRNRSNYEMLYYWLTVAIRYYVGLTLFNYGIIKVIKLQFESPGLYRLSEPIGDLSPMGLAWTFLGFSAGYNVFMGIIEIAGLFLLFSRTITLGAIIALVATSNVMAVNYFFDVSVKIISTALVIMTLFLLLKDSEPLFKFFFLGEHASLSKIKNHVLKRRWMRISKTGIKMLVIGYVVIYGTIRTCIEKNQYEISRNKSNVKFYGLYDVDTFVVNHDTLSSEPVNWRWHQLIIENNWYARVRFKGDSVAVFFTTVDTAQHTITFTDRANPGIRCFLKYEFFSPANLNLSGEVKDDSVFISAARREMEPKSYRLIKRGFHWINEYPYNR